MKITFSDVVLADGVNTHVSGLRFDGRRQVQEAQLLRASAAKLFNRGNKSLSISFSVSASWATLREAELAALALWDELPEEGSAVITCGNDGDTDTLTFGDAVLESLGAVQVGVRIVYNFIIRAAKVTTTTALEIPPLNPI